MTKDVSKMTRDELLAFTQALMVKAAAAQKITLKVSEKGGLSLYGLGRWPVTLYKSQWLRLCAEIPVIEKFIEANSDKLVTKE